MTQQNRNAPSSGQAVEASNETSSEQMLFPQPQSVKGRVLGAFLRRERLTHLDCWQKYGSARLSHHVYMLRSADWPIQMVEDEVTTSDADRTATIGVYWLDIAAIDKAGERGQQYASETLRVERERRGR